jgi:hypothetical protein
VAVVLAEVLLASQYLDIFVGDPAVVGIELEVVGIGIEAGSQ